MSCVSRPLSNKPPVNCAMPALKFKNQESPESIEKRQRRQRRYKRHKKAGIREVRRFHDMQFLYFLLVEVMGFLPRGVDFDEGDLVIGYLAFEADNHGDWYLAYNEW